MFSGHFYPKYLRYLRSIETSCWFMMADVPKTRIAVPNARNCGGTLIITKAFRNLSKICHTFMNNSG